MTIKHKILSLLNKSKFLWKIKKKNVNKRVKKESEFVLLLNKRIDNLSLKMSQVYGTDESDELKKRMLSSKLKEVKLIRKLVVHGQTKKQGSKASS